MTERRIFRDAGREEVLDADCLAEARRIADDQARDAGLWFVAQTAAEAYLQQELRRLTAAVEGDKWTMGEKA